MPFFTRLSKNLNVLNFKEHQIIIRYLLLLLLCTGSFLTKSFAQQPPACDIITSSNCSSTLTGCVNQQIAYTANVVFYGGATYTWDFPVNTSGAFLVSGQGTTNPIVNVGPNAGQFILRLTMVNPAGTTTCTASLTVIQLTSASSVVTTSCSSATLTVSANGGIPPYTYTLSPGNVSNGTGIFTGLTPGTYTTSITNDATACSTSNTIIITGGNSTLTTTESHANAGCSGSAIGYIDLSVSGGTAPYSYVWTTTGGGIIPAGQTNTQDLMGLVPGTYTVTVTDAAGCITIRTIIIDSTPSNIEISMSYTNISCFGNNDGGIDLTVTGGTAPYSYVWSASAGGIIPSGQQNSDILTGLTAGNYSVLVTDANGCTATQNFTITGPATGIIIESTQTNVACFGGFNGAINLAVAGGTGNYTYIWTAANGGIIPAGQSTNQDLVGLTAGIYNVVVTDGAGCTKIYSVTLTQPSIINIEETHTDVSCSGSGSINISVSGGTAPYTYAWTTIGGMIPAGQANNQDLTGLVPGGYTVLVTDARGCLRSKTIIIAQSETGIVTEVSSVNVSCFNGTNGSINLSVPPGSAYTYLWTASAGGLIPPGQMNNQDLSGISAGTYTVVVTAIAGCSATRTIVITQPTALNVSGVDTPEGCQPASGSINISITGGTPPYTYSWSGTEGGVIPAGQVNNQDLTGLVPGMYTITITDQNGCNIIRRTSIGHVCGAPLPCANFATSFTQTNVGCTLGSAGSINLSVIGGTAPYSYLWTASGGGIIPPNQMNNQDLSGLIAGTYHVVVTDANSCTTIRTIVITQALGITATYTATNVSCFEGNNGSIDLTATGSTPLNYSWVATGGGAIPAGQANLQDLTGLKAGVYTVLISGGACTPLTLSVTISQPDNIIASGTQTNIICGSVSGNINLSVSGGTAPYTYVWTTTGGSIPNGQSNQQDLSGISTGTYVVIITDAKGCTKTKSFTIIQSVSNLEIIATATNVICFEGNTGSINVLVNGGVGNYTYSWTATNGGVIPAGQVNNQNLTGLVAGKYTVEVNSGNGCTKSKTVIITQPAPMLLTLSQNNVSICGAANGSINLSVSGNVAPYTYLWIASNGGVVPAGQSNNQDLSGLKAGTYGVTVTSAIGCVSTRTVVITQNCGNGNTNEYGCDYKYWRSNTHHWNQLNDYVVTQMPASLRFISSTNFFTYFNVSPGSAGLPNNLTMESALHLNGNGCKHLSKYAVSALLTVASGQTVTYPSGTGNFTSLYNAIRTALLNSNCNGTLKNQLKHIKQDCSGNNDDDDDNNGGNNDDNDDNNDDEEDDDDDDKVSQPGVTVGAYPNPYTDKLVFKIKSNVSGSAVFELYSFLGDKIGLLYQGPITKDVEKKITYNSIPANRKNLVYKLRVGNIVTTGKVLYLN